MPLVDGNGWEYHVLLDPNGTLKRAMNVQNVPHLFVLNSKGEIVYNHAGYMDGDILQKGIAGYHVKLYIEKYALDNGMLLSKEEVAQSKYAKVDEVVVRITPDVTEPPLPSEDSNATEDTEFTEPTVNTSPTDSTEASDIAA
jgi:hypothetical protein